MSVKIYEQEINKIGKKDTWKYFTSIFNVMDAVKYYRLATKVVLEEKTKENKEISFGIKERREEEKYSFLQGDLMPFADRNVSRLFLNSLYVKNFYQYSRNAFDYVSHLINEFFVKLDNRIKNCDFSKIYSIRDQICNKAAKKWIKDVYDSKEFKYINNYSNQIKHNYDMGIRHMLDTSTFEISCQIPEFEKGGIAYSSEDGLKKMETTHEYVAKVLVAFIEIIRDYLDALQDDGGAACTN